jgi:hypothetical protein
VLTACLKLILTWSFHIYRRNKGWDWET